MLKQIIRIIQSKTSKDKIHIIVTAKIGKTCLKAKTILQLKE
jgi:hypothetical protein